MTKKFTITLFVLLFNSFSLFAQSPALTKYETEAYEIFFPNKFEKSFQPLKSSLGELIMTIISYEPAINLNDSNYVYMVMETTYPDSAIHSDKTEMLDEFFKATIKGSVVSVNGKLIKETKGMTGKYPNRTVEIDFQNGLAVIQMTMILRDSRMIIIETITNTKNFPNSSISKFLDSFRLK